MGSYLLLASRERSVSATGRKAPRVHSSSRAARALRARGGTMAIDQLERKLVVDKPRVTNREMGNGAIAPGSTVMRTYRTTAKIVGAVYLAGFVVGIAGSGIFQSILGPTGASANLPAVAASA